MRLPGASCITAATRRIPPRKIQICPAYRRQVLKQALRQGWITALQDGPAFARWFAHAYAGVDPD